MPGIALEQIIMAGLIGGIPYLVALIMFALRNEQRITRVETRLCDHLDEHTRSRRKKKSDET